MIVPTRILVALTLLGGMAVAWTIWYELWKARQGIARQPTDGDSGGWLDSWWGDSGSSADGGLDLD